MAHGGYSKRRVNPAGRRSKSALGPEKKPKSVTLKNQIRSIERMLRKNLPAEVREAQEKKLEGFKKQQEIHSRLAVERKIFMRDRKIKFFERRKIERRLRRLEKLQRASSGQAQDAEILLQLSKLKEDLEYVRFFPKTEKYVSLFTGGEDTDVIDKRNKLRKQIKANIVAAAASGKDLEETGSEDDGLLDMSEDDFFLNGSSSDEADADDEWTDKSAKEQASSASGKATSGMSSDERNQRQISARALMPPPRPSSNSRSSSVHAQSRFGPSSSKNSSKKPAEMTTSSNTSNSRSGTSFNTSNSNTSSSRSETSFKDRGSSNSTAGQSSNLSSNSDAHKPRRKRRPKKKKQQG
ncbi:rRNA-processing protein EFG1-like [Pyrus ussuriensis x Pyrus communis]|uniref:rRNA-processing protein EFG1 n=1 Tax=Pyrus ussuriensis x Pyrus communis TaxID=2448454 RepID=A0A5N5F9J5_9ROSA|nr:rRNA-processing protein EFG1 isoform X1 [Pyrus x bretschneideri]KAB2599738.1 rRNA-processing protein EFG1-like [Pyrus ussuriensis x Pyrus communis]